MAVIDMAGCMAHSHVMMMLQARAEACAATVHGKIYVAAGRVWGWPAEHQPCLILQRIREDGHD